MPVKRAIQVFAATVLHGMYDSVETHQSILQQKVKRNIDPDEALRERIKHQVNTKISY